AFADIEGVREITGFSPGEVSDLIAFVPNRERVDEAAAALRQALREVGLTAGEVKVSTWREMGGVIAGMVKSYGVMLDLLLGTLSAVVCILAINLVFITSLERQQEIGTLRAIGFRRSVIVWLFAAEIMLVVVTFAYLGFLAGTGLVAGLAKVALPAGPQWSSLLGDRFYLRLDVKGAVPSLMVTILMTLGAVTWPAYKAASVKPVEALRYSDQV
ncbi:MAG: FtsX-like permease family protein, partial [Firmicutes bacterium]|nr:FtsX-like permease family protein [Bacillota bacterium]